MNLTNYFLIAMPQIGDSVFEGSLVYICEHDDEGAMGVIVNKPSSIALDQVLTTHGQPLAWRYHQDFLLMGGPLHTERGFILHTPLGEWQSSLQVSEQVALTVSNDIMASLANQDKIHQFLITMGYSSWGKGQLEQELTQNVWLTVEADTDILFEVPAHLRYEAALQKLGIRSSTFLSRGAHA